MTALAQRQSDRPVTVERSLSELEAVIETVIETGPHRFMDVGTTLLEIQTRNLYQERGFRRFEDYCADRFHLSERRAYQFIAAATAVSGLKNFSAVPPPCIESHARELFTLTKKDPEVAAAVWRDVYEANGGKPTMRAIRQAVQKQQRKEEVTSPDQASIVNSRVSTSSEAIQRRHDQIRRMVNEGYRDAQIADAVGLKPLTVRLLIYEWGLPTEAQRIGKTRHIDHNRAMGALIENSTPTHESIGVIDWSQLDKDRFPEWERALGTTIQTLTQLRNRMKRLMEGTRGR